ncbi:MAG: helix-turn-helix domain-containing protein [Vicinamibacterales bacterium]
MGFRAVVAAEFERRQRQNPRYSLRGFARLLGVHHATLSRLLNGAGPVHPRTIGALGPRLGLTPSQMTKMVAAEDAVALTAAIRRAAFRPDSRWLASVSGMSVDRVNIALQRLLRSGRLQMRSANQWVLN